MNKMKFLEKQKYKPFKWLRYIDDIFFIWTHGVVNIKQSWKIVTSFTLK